MSAWELLRASPWKLKPESVTEIAQNWSGFDINADKSVGGRMCRRQLFTTFATVSLLMAATDAAEADPATFMFTGACASGIGEDCSAFGLPDGAK